MCFFLKFKSYKGSKAKGHKLGVKRTNVALFLVRNSTFRFSRFNILKFILKLSEYKFHTLHKMKSKKAVYQ